VSPEPVARRLPVGEKEAHRIGDACPTIYLMGDGDGRRAKKMALTGERRRTTGGWTNLEHGLGRAVDDDDVFWGE